MEPYIVRQPILDKNRKVIAYEVLYKEDETSLYNAADMRVANAIEQFIMELGNEKFLAGRPAFLTFTPNLLMKNIPKLFPASRLVIQIDDSALVHPLAQKIIYRYKKQGYRIALRGFEFSPRYFGVLDVVDIIKVDMAGEPAAVANIAKIAHSFHKEVAAWGIETQEALKLARELECDYLQGTFVAEQRQSKVHRFDHMQSNFFQLMIAVSREEPDIDEITDIVSRDVTIAFSLMKLVNSAYFALRNRVQSVQQAVVILGIRQLKQWIYLLSFKSEAGSVSEELIKTSFLRGSFCQELSHHISDLPITAAEAYMMGMFSTLGTLMEVPLAAALSELPISGEIKGALISGEGTAGALYQMVLCYERASWGQMTEYADQLGIPVNIITRTYFGCVEEVNRIWTDLQQPAAPA